MLGLIIVAIIIFAIVQKRRYRRRIQWTKRGWRYHASQVDRYASKFEQEMRRKFGGKSSRWEEQAAKFEQKAAQFEEKLRQKLDPEKLAHDLNDKIHRDFAGSIAAKAGFDPGEEPTFKTEAERQAYMRARKRAAAEAGFYVHLMWYGLVIGFLFLINLMTGGLGGYPWFLWPALGWGVGIASHFSAVFGWRWIHERVFQPAIQREVRREVMQEKEVLRTEKQASLDELTATFAHEIRNPIAAAKSLVQQMGEDPTSHENVEYAKVALEELARVERSVSHLLKYAKEEDYRFENVNLAAVLDGALTQMRSKLEANAVKVSRSYLSGPTVRADTDKLRQVFSNIIDNAIDSMAEVKSERRIELSIQGGRGGLATVRIRDNGCGIPADKISKIFNPFYTSKQNGTGLGLGVAKKVIEAHRGAIDVNSTVGAGTEFAISVPLADAEREARAAEAADASEDSAASPSMERPEPVAQSNAATRPIAVAAAALPVGTTQSQAPERTRPLGETGRGQ
jgi:signal transduction histidine kinase